MFYGVKVSQKDIRAMEYKTFAKEFCDIVEQENLQDNGDIQDYMICDYLDDQGVKYDELDAEYDKICKAIEKERETRDK